MLVNGRIKRYINNPTVDPLGNTVKVFPTINANLEGLAIHFGAGAGKTVSDISAKRLLSISVAHSAISDPHIITRQSDGRSRYISLYEDSSKSLDKYGEVRRLG